MGRENVKDPKHGAKGDGVADDTAAIQSAIQAAVVDNLGGTVYFPSGVYNVSRTIRLEQDYLTLLGEGVAVIRGIGNFYPVVQVGSASSQPNAPVIRNLWIDRDLQGQQKGCTIGLLYVGSKHPQNCKFEDLRIYGHERNLVLDSLVPEQPNGHRPEGRTIWTNCEFGSYSGMDRIAVDHIYGVEQVFLNCRIQGYTETGYLKQAGDSADSRFIGCYIGSAAGAFSKELLFSVDFESSFQKELDSGSVPRKLDILPNNGVVWVLEIGSEWAVNEVYIVAREENKLNVYKRLLPMYCADILGGFDTHFIDCVFEEGHDINVRFRGGRINSIEGCYVGGAGRTGLGIAAVSHEDDIYQLEIVGNTICNYAQRYSRHPGRARAIYLQQNGTRNTIHNVTIGSNQIDVQGDYGIWVDGATDVAISGNTFRRLGRPKAAILVGENSQRVAITGNVIRTGDETHSVVLCQSSRLCTVVGNVLAGPYLDNGKTNVIEANSE